MKRVNIYFERFKSFLFRYKFLVVAFIFLLVIGIILIPRAFAQPVKSVEIISDNVSFEKKDPGAWKVDKSAKWTSKGEAEITFDVDTIMKTNNKYTDVLFVLDVSGSMDGDKLNRVKADSIELIESLLSNGENKAGLITFESTSNIVLDFTKDEDLLKEKINSLTTTGCTNYYQALVNVDEVLKNYKKEKGRECVILFLTDGYPNEDTPNEETQYSYLKQQFPFITINGIQYEMGTNVLEPVKKVSDNQFIADMDTLNNVLFDASVTPITYDEFSITDYIDTNYFYVEDESNIKVSQGKINLDNDNQKVTWTINEFKSGFKAKMTIKVKLKDELIVEGGYFSTNLKEMIKSKIDDIEESVTSSKTPILANNYKVVYDGNAPDGCNVEGIPNSKIVWPTDVVGLSDNVPKCKGYEFKGWGIVTKNVKRIRDDYFVMSEEDVVIRAQWSKLSIDKSVDGKVYTRISSTMEKVSIVEEEIYLGGGTWDTQLIPHSTLIDSGYSIKKIVFQNQYNVMTGATDVLDLSEEKNGGIIAYIFPDADDNSVYTAYIQGDGKIVLNEDSSSLFSNFGSLKTIEGLEYLDTTNVKNMSSMFSSCLSLTSLDLSNFDTTNVTDMSFMFKECSSLTSLNLSGFDTSSVEDMRGMFNRCGNLTSLDVSGFVTSKVTLMGGYYESGMFSCCSSLASLDLSNFDTSKVTDMGNMFNDCSSLTSLDLSNFDTSSVTNMSSMFDGCSSLTSSNLSSFDVSSVTSMRSMFSGCSSLASLDLSNFDTSKVTDMSYMFYGCSSLTSLYLSSFDTLKVTYMSYMFYGCSSLTSLDLSNFNTASVTTMSEMFYNCRSLTSLDLSNFDTSKVLSMCGKNYGGMFQNCSSLTSLNLSSFNTSKIGDMSYMFNGCSSLISLDLSSFDTSNVRYMDSIFSGCSSLVSLNLNNFDTSNLTNMGEMFIECRSLTNLNLSSFNTSKVTNMGSMFSDCSSLISLNLSSFDTSEVINMRYMFDGCSSLKSLDVSSFNTSKVTNMGSMFSDCSSLTSLDLSNFDTSNVTSMSVYSNGMFENCSSLISLDVSSFNTSKVTSMESMFSGCSSLTSLDLSNFDTSKVTNMESMFSGCRSLSTTISILNELYYYSNYQSYYGYYYMFKEAATVPGAQITVNYTENVADVINTYIATKSYNSNVVKGELVTIGT